MLSGLISHHPQTRFQVVYRFHGWFQRELVPNLVVGRGWVIHDRQDVALGLNMGDVQVSQVSFDIGAVLQYGYVPCSVT